MFQHGQPSPISNSACLQCLYSILYALLVFEPYHNTPSIMHKDIFNKGRYHTCREPRTVQEILCLLCRCTHSSRHSTPSGFHSFSSSIFLLPLKFVYHTPAFSACRYPTGVFLPHILHTSASSLPLDFLIPAPSEFYGGLPFCGLPSNPVLLLNITIKGIQQREFLFRA